MKILELKCQIYLKKQVTADKIHEEFKKKKKLMINAVMSSPGSGKTTLLSHAINEIKDIIK